MLYLFRDIFMDLPLAVLLICCQNMSLVELKEPQTDMQCYEWLLVPVAFCDGSGLLLYLPGLCFLGYFLTYEWQKILFLGLALSSR